MNIWNYMTVCLYTKASFGRECEYVTSNVSSFLKSTTMITMAQQLDVEKRRLSFPPSQPLLLHQLDQLRVTLFNAFTTQIHPRVGQDQLRTILKVLLDGKHKRCVPI